MSITSELAFEEYIESYLLTQHKYTKRLNEHYHKSFCMDIGLMMEFLRSTQAKELAKLQDYYGEQFEQKFFQRLSAEIQQKWLLEVLRKWIKDQMAHLYLRYWLPNSNLNQETKDKFDQNIFSVIRQLRYSENNGNSIDTVIFVNGLPLYTIELKNHLSGQTISNAIHQYKFDRDSKEPLLQFKRCLVHWAVDPDIVYMTTKLEWANTYFLPFNKWNNLWAGNPINPNWYKVSYLREDIFNTTTTAELIDRYICLQVEEKKNPETGKITKSEKLIFPRYHQIDCVRNIIDNLTQVWVGTNYLIQHSAWSGKSNSIARLSHHLAEFHSTDNTPMFDSVIVITDRRVLDKQLQNTIAQFAQTKWVVVPIEDGSKSLKTALESWAKIIISTIQKFPYVLKDMESLQWYKFAIIVDEAHSSQSGEHSKALKQVLSLNSLNDESDNYEDDSEDHLNDYIRQALQARGKMKHISFFAFTATPKNKTLELFGVKTQLWWEDQYNPFHLYSMKQAIEEWFILDVLKNYTPYKRFFDLVKKVSHDEEFDKKKANKVLMKYVDLHEYTIETKIKIIVDHFMNTIRHELNGKAKAMIVTRSRLHAVKFKLALNEYLKQQWYTDQSLVAFSWTIEDTSTGIEYTESSMNWWLSDKHTAEEFKKDNYKFLIVANKFQTGFDQPLLCAMYVDKTLNGIEAVQTLSRLNRTMYGKEQTFVLDFTNETETIQKSFQPYYQTTVLSWSTDPNKLHDILHRIQEPYIINEQAVDNFLQAYHNPNTNPSYLNALIDPMIQAYIQRDASEEDKKERKDHISDFCKLYGFISQILDYSSSDREKWFVFLKFFKKKLPYTKTSLPIEIMEQISPDHIKIVKQASVNIWLSTEDWSLDPLQPGTTKQLNPEDKDWLSGILSEINKKFAYDFSENDKVILNARYQQINQNSRLQEIVTNSNNSKDNAKLVFKEIAQKEQINMIKNHTDFFGKLWSNKEQMQFIMETMFDFMWKAKEKDLVS